MKEVGVLEAKTRLSALLAEVESTGESIAITRHGRRVAELVPSRTDAAVRKRPWAEVLAEIRAREAALLKQHPALAEPYDLREDRDAIE